ncbi:MAG: hypothetical protein ACOYNI_10500 [Acidimicrobiia bacterium]
MEQDAVTIDTVVQALDAGKPVYLRTHNSVYRLSPGSDGSVTLESTNARFAGRGGLVGDRTFLSLQTDGPLLFQGVDGSRLKTSPVVEIERGIEGPHADEYVQAEFAAVLERDRTVFVETQRGSEPKNIWAVTALDASERDEAARNGQEGATHQWVSLRSIEKDGVTPPTLANEVGLVGVGRPMVLGTFSKSGRVLLTGSVVAFEGPNGPRGLDQQFNDRVMHATMQRLGVGQVGRAPTQRGTERS